MLLKVCVLNCVLLVRSLCLENFNLWCLPPASIICTQDKEREAKMDRQDSLDALEEEQDVAKARSAFYQQQARRYQSREVRAKTYNVGELVLRLPDKKKDKLKPKWEGPFIIDQVLTGGAYRLRNASDN